MKKYDPRQSSFPGFFEVPRAAESAPGAFDFDGRLRRLLNDAVKRCDKSRAVIAAEMTDLVFGDAGEGEITKAQLDSWTAPSRGEWRFPLCYLPAFIKVTGAVDLLDAMAALVGCKVLAGEAVIDAELGRIDRQIAQLNERRKTIKAIRRRP